MRNNLIVKTTDLALHMLTPYIRLGDSFVDATMGNGYDTLQLAFLTGADRGIGTVYSFDIQQEAINQTEKLLNSKDIPYKKVLGEEEISRTGIHLIHDSHEQIKRYVKENISGAMFNLGYLPGQDKSKTTRAQTTIAALDTVLTILRVNGAVSLVIYGGHEEGAIERRTLLDYASELEAAVYHSAYIEMINQQAGAPSIMMITKKKEQNFT